MSGDIDPSPTAWKSKRGYTTEEGTMVSRTYRMALIAVIMALFGGGVVYAQEREPIVSDG